MQIRRQRAEQKPEIAMTPLIDCVFLLLIYFMVTSAFYRQEADISFALPGVARQEEAVAIPDEQVIEIYDNGSVVLNDLRYDAPDDPALPELTFTLKRFRATAEANRTEAMITIAPGDRVKHQRVVDVLNACAAAQISNVTFAVEEEM